MLGWKWRHFGGWNWEQDFLSVLLQLWLDWGTGEGTQLTPGTRASIDHYPSIIIERVSRCKNRFKFCTHKASNAQFYWKLISNLIRPHCWCWKLMMFIFLFKIDLQKNLCMMSRTSELSVVKAQILIGSLYNWRCCPRTIVTTEPVWVSNGKANWVILTGSVQWELLPLRRGSAVSSTSPPVL